MLFDFLLKNLVRTGTLTAIDARGRTRTYGDGGTPRATVRTHDQAIERRIALNPSLYVGEAYMDGRLTIEEGSLYDFLELGIINMVPAYDGIYLRSRLRLSRLWRWLQQYNTVGSARRNAAHHYDLSGRLYSLFLDRDRQYSCAYFRTPEDSLETAQENKKRHIAAKLLLKPGQRVLDIGSGWGGMGLFLARHYGVEVTGVTLSREQHAESNRRAAEAGLADRVRFLLQDYREVEGRFDRILSVGMFEHVGVVNHPIFFAKLRRLLADDGVALLHSIGRSDGPGTTNPWLRKYIFPGGYSPALSEVLAVVEKSRLWVTDIEILRLHYAETLRLWRRRFQANRDAIAAIYDERFCRMWEFYLVGSELSFRYQGHMVFQMQLARQQTAVPLTRDYITEAERTEMAGGSPVGQALSSESSHSTGARL